MKSAFIFLLILFTGHCYAQYRCIENGRTWYTNTPCRATDVPGPQKSGEQTAAQIQAEFEREVAAKHAQEQRAEIEANDRGMAIKTEEARKHTATPASSPSHAKSSPSGSWSVWNYAALGLVILFTSPIFAFFRRKQAPPAPTANDLIEQQRQDQYRAQLRADIERAVTAHLTATQLLQALARIDGITSEAERRIVFQFLKNQGATLEEKHFPLFYGNHAEEFQHAVDDETILVLLQTLAAMNLAYRIDVISAASAIVATGGTPKKREAETLSMIRSALNPAL